MGQSENEPYGTVTKASFPWISEEDMAVYKAAAGQNPYERKQDVPMGATSKEDIVKFISERKVEFEQKSGAKKIGHFSSYAKCS